MGTVEVEWREGGVATVWLSNGQRRNALSNAMVVALADAMEDLATRTDCTAVVLRGRDGVFCAGRDLHDLAALQSKDAAAVTEMYGHMQRMNEAVWFAPMPTVSVVERYALGIGTMIATWADITLAEEGAIFGYPEVRHGITPFGAVPTMLATMDRKGMLDLLLTGRKVDAVEAVRLGIATRAVPPDRLDAELETVLADLAAGSAEAIRGSKAFVRACEGETFRRQITAATERAIASIRRPEMRAGVAAFVAGKGARLQG